LPATLWFGVSRPLGHLVVPLLLFGGPNFLRSAIDALERTVNVVLSWAVSWILLRRITRDRTFWKDGIRRYLKSIKYLPLDYLGFSFRAARFLTH
jgi:hypothetical protein